MRSSRTLRQPQSHLPPQSRHATLRTIPVLLHAYLCTPPIHFQALTELTDECRLDTCHSAARDGKYGYCPTRTLLPPSSLPTVPVSPNTLQTPAPPSPAPNPSSRTPTATTPATSSSAEIVRLLCPSLSPLPPATSTPWSPSSLTQQTTHKRSAPKRQRSGSGRARSRRQRRVKPQTGRGTGRS